jgi:hypothetical protein
MTLELLGWEHPAAKSIAPANNEATGAAASRFAVERACAGGTDTMAISSDMDESEAQNDVRRCRDYCEWSSAARAASSFSIRAISVV